MTHDPRDQDHPPTSQPVHQLPCPAWCELPAGHPFRHPLDDDALDDPDARHDSPPGPLAVRYRIHRRRFGDRATHVSVETCEHHTIDTSAHALVQTHERTIGTAGPTDLGADPDATVVRIQLNHGHGYLTSAGARRLALMLNDAADLADLATHDDGAGSETP